VPKKPIPSVLGRSGRISRDGFFGYLPCIRRLQEEEEERRKEEKNNKKKE
jgi:hypothetical protein